MSIQLHSYNILVYLSCAVVTKSGNLNFLEHFRPVQACNGTALPSHFTYLYNLRVTYSGGTVSGGVDLLPWQQCLNHPVQGRTSGLATGCGRRLSAVTYTPEKAEFALSVERL